MKRALLLLPLLTTGCEEIEPFLPTVAFDTLQMQRVDFEGAEADFVFEVQNPNPVQIDLASFSYALELADTPLLDGDNADGFTLEAAGGSELRLPIAIDWQDTWQTVQATRGLDDVPFGLTGEFGFDTPAGRVPLPYSEGGSFPALRTPTFRLADLRVERVNLTSAELALDLGVDNAHGSTLFFDRFDYGVQIGGRSVATGLIQTFEVDGASEGRITLPIDISPVAVGLSLFEVIVGGGRLDVDLDATMDVETPFGILPLSIDEAGALDVILPD